MINRKNLLTIGGLVAVTAIATFIPVDVLAQDGRDNANSQGLIDAVSGLIESNYGLFIGLLVAALGLWRWLMSQDSWGVMLIIGGIVITAFPGIFGGFYNGTRGFLQAAGAEGNASQTQDIGGGAVQTQN